MIFHITNSKKNDYPAGAGLRSVSCFAKAKYFLPLTGKAQIANLRQQGHQGGSKTTEIYTHITTKGFNQIKSPPVKLNIV